MSPINFIVVRRNTYNWHLLVVQWSILKREATKEMGMHGEGNQWQEQRTQLNRIISKN